MNELEEEIKKKSKPQKMGVVLVRVWDDGVVDSRYFVIDKTGRGPALKIPLPKSEFLTQMRSMVQGMKLDDLELPSVYNKPAEQVPASEKPQLIGTAELHIYDDGKVIPVFTSIQRTEERGAPRKNSTLRENEWKHLMNGEVGTACDSLRLSV